MIHHKCHLNILVPLLNQRLSEVLSKNGLIKVYTDSTENDEKRCKYKFQRLSISYSQADRSLETAFERYVLNCHCDLFTLKTDRSNRSFQILVCVHNGISAAFEVLNCEKCCFSSYVSK